MTIWSKIKKFFDIDNGKNEQVTIIPAKIEDIDIQPIQTAYSKFEAEFHNPRLTCFGCQSRIEEGKVRFMNVGSEEKAFHKACLKKMKSGKVPNQA